MGSTGRLRTVRAMVNSRSKGQRGERLFAELLRQFGWNAAERSGQTKGTQVPDVTGGPERVHWEVKFAERLNVRDAYHQAAYDAHAGDMPVVAWKASRRPWLAVLRMDDLLELLRELEAARDEVCGTQTVELEGDDWDW